MSSFLFVQWFHIISCVLLYYCGLVLYRVYFSPLSRFPGPKLAAATFLYEAYYDFVQGGRYPWKVRDLHRQYGPVVRVNPREIHIYDPDYVDQLFVQRLDKDPWFARGFGIPLTGVGTCDHNLHRTRRGAINKFFSKTSIGSRVGIIQDRVLKLCSKLEASAGTDEVVHLDAGFICLTLDIISQFCYEVDYGYLDIPGFDRDMKQMMENVFGAGALLRFFPFILTITQSLPVWMVMRLMPQVAGLLRVQEMVRAEAKRMLSSHTPKKSTPIQEVPDAESYYNTTTAGPSPETTIFSQILSSSKLCPQEKSLDRLVQEGQALLTAGSETTSRVLYLSAVHLLLRPDLLSCLRRELDRVLPEPSLRQLEHLPFLTAVIKEGIRLSGSIVMRLSRVSNSSQTGPIRYKEHVFPLGTPVSVTLFDVLMDETIFPEPERFDPYRWLVHGEEGEGGEEGMLRMNSELDRYFVAFSRGPRSCVGMWLARAELYITLAQVLGRFEMELYETGVEDVEAACDKTTCFARPGGKGVRVKVLGLRGGV